MPEFFFDPYKMKKYILEAKNISKSFGNVKALEDVNFYLQKGKIHG